jgi:hypothetical protein
MRACLIVVACLVLCPASVFAQSFTVAWEHPLDRQGGIGYTVYVGTAPNTYNVTSFDVGNVTQAIVNVPSYGAYYVAIKSYDINGNRGDFSNEVQATLTAPPPPPPPPPSGCVTNGVTYSAGTRATFTVRIRDFEVWLTARESEGWVFVQAVPQNRNQWRVTVECQR